MDCNQLQRWQVILNPHAGCGKCNRDKELIIRELQNAHLLFDVHISTFPGHAKELSYSLCIHGFTHFIAVGGDGTLHEVANGICSSGKISESVVGVIPVGTGNDWIRTFGIPDHYKHAAELIKEAKSVKQSVGIIQHNNNLRYFVNMAGFGFDAIVAGKANSLKNNGISGLRVYLQSFLWSYFHYRTNYSLVVIDNKSIRVPLFSLSVGIGKFNGGGMMQVPDANPLEGLFHITIIRKIGVWGILWNFKRLYTGSFVTDKRVSVHSGSKIRIRALKQLAGEADGESLGLGNFCISLHNEPLRVICGQMNF